MTDEILFGDKDCVGIDGRHFIGLSKIEQKKMTNADHIRSMSDEELAYWYFNEFFRKVPYCRKEECYEDSPCEECLLDWLKEEVKEK